MLQTRTGYRPLIQSLSVSKQGTSFTGIRERELMHNRFLETFIVAADCGSLTKASETLYLSPTAIMKQINQLEQHLGVKLFIRSNKGLFLTEAGKSIYADGVYMIQFSKEAQSRAIKATSDHAYHIRIGTSLMCPAQAISKLLQDITSQNPEFQFHIVPFNDFREDYAHIVSHLGEKIDVIAGVYGFSEWTSQLHDILTLSDEPICIAVSQNHRLASKDCINISDLYGETVFITEPGDSKTLDLIRKDITKHHHDIQLLNMKTFDLMIYNQCATTNNVLLTIPMWASLHPMLKIIKVNWSYSVPYGIIYSQNPDIGVQKFIDYCKRFASATTLSNTL